MVSGININSALNLYQTAANRGVSNSPLQNGGGSANSASSGAAGNSFGDVLGNTVDQAVEATKNAEQFSSKAIAGEADITDVVMAVANAELALETVVSVRDKATAAYQEIMKMPI